MLYAKFPRAVTGQGGVFISLGTGVFQPSRHYHKFKSQMQMLQNFSDGGFFQPQKLNQNKTF